MAGPFRENITNWWRSSTAALRPFSWASTASASTRSRRRGYDGALPDIQTLAMEFAHLIAQARRTLQSLDAGALEEFTLRTDTLTLVVRVLTPGVLPGLRRAADAEPGQGQVPHADDRARRCAPTCETRATCGHERTRLPMSKKDQKAKSSLKVVPPRPRGRARAATAPASTSNRCASWRASPPSSTWRRSRPIGSGHVRVRRGGGGAWSSGARAVGPAADRADARAAGRRRAAEAGHVITSPFVGTFYRSPSPDAPPFVEVGPARCARARCSASSRR